MAQTKVLDTTREMVQRVQVGLAGLLGVLAIIGLASLMTRNARVDDSGLAMSKEGAAIADAPSNNAIISPAVIPNEPLADLGVTPSSDPSLTAPPAVPDLEPDPRLTTPMDRDPRKAQQQQQQQSQPQR
ncbi:hypothetical protein [Sphingobium sp. CR28]|uniref:hypothetical protein n=1 Tax=Sphingobium sp. CR28 TaxID=3400272 RepID=UPI003FF05F35